jgi:hypothetical protein
MEETPQKITLNVAGGITLDVELNCKLNVGAVSSRSRLPEFDVSRTSSREPQISWTLHSEATIK